MKSLIEIVQIVNKKRINKLEILSEDVLKNKKSKFNEFYEGLSSSKFKNDRDAALTLYNCGPSNAKYRQLKSRFKRRLLNTIFFLNVNIAKNPNYERAHFSCNKDWVLVQALLSNGARQSGINLARQILTSSLKFKFTDLIVHCARILREAASEEGDTKDFDKYNDLVLSHSEILAAEIRSEEYLQKTRIQYASPDLLSKSELDGIEEYCNELVQLSEKIDSPVLFYYMFSIWAMRFEMLRDFGAMLEVCEEAKQYFENEAVHFNQEKIKFFYTKEMAAYLHLKDYQGGKGTAEVFFKKFGENSQRWFEFMEYYFLLAIHSERYIKAIAIYNETTNNKAFFKLDNVNKEKWFIFEAFLRYLIEKFQLQTPISENRRRKVFRPKQFIHHIPIHARENRILNVLTYILQFLFLLEKKKFIEMDDRLNTLKNISTNRLKKNLYERPILFIGLLQQLKKAHYFPKEINNTSKYLDKLKKKPFSYRGNIWELEVIPFEKIWAIIIK